MMEIFLDTDLGAITYRRARKSFMGEAIRRLDTIIAHY